MGYISLEMTAVKMDSNYDSASTVQRQMGNQLVEYMWTALQSCERHETVTIVDFGAATGLNFCKMVRPVLERFRQISPAPLLIYHNDLPGNHWNALFSNITSSPESYASISNVYTYAVGKSFYSQLFPCNSVDVAFACAAFHWLSHPSDEPGQIFPPQSYPGGLHPALQTRFREDLTANLQARYRELKPGAHLIFELPHRDVSIRTYITPIVEVLIEMHLSGLLPPGYLENFPMPLVTETFEVCLSHINSLQPEFEILETKQVTEKFELYRMYEETGDLEGFAKAFAEFWKGFSYPYLKGRCTQGEEGETTIQLFYQKIEENIRKKPEPIYLPHSFFHLRRPVNS